MIRDNERRYLEIQELKKELQKKKERTLSSKPSFIESVESSI